MWVVLESIIWKNSMPHCSFVHFGGGLCFLVAFFLCSLSIQAKKSVFKGQIWGISSNQPIMWRFQRPSACIKLHDSLNNLNKSHDYSIGSVIKIGIESLLNCHAVSWKNFVKFWPYFEWEHIFIWINVNKERMRRKVRYGISNLFFFLDAVLSVTYMPLPILSTILDSHPPT